MIEHVRITIRSGHFLEVERSKKCTPLWREARFESKGSNYHMLGPLLDDSIPIPCRKVHAVVARSTFGSKKCQPLKVLSNFRCSDVVLLTDGYRNI